MKIIRWLTFIWGCLALLTMIYYVMQWVLQEGNPARHELGTGVGFGLIYGWPAWLGLPALALAFLDRKELSRLRILFLLSPVALAVIVLVIFGSLGG